MMPVAFQIWEHLAELNVWMARRGLGPITKGMIPEVGRILPGVAAGFLYQSDSRIAFLDNFVTNPRAPYGDRQGTLDVIAEMLMLRARELGFSHLVAMTKVDGIRERALRLGFRETGPVHMLIREL